MGELYNLIIIDDETLIREGLRDMVDWESLGFRVVACFEDGADALDFLELNPVDAILTDIIMNDVNGIELAKYVSENRPEIRVVVLSGYRNFEFARQAMRYHACNYLLKPVDFGELQTVFEAVKREIDGNRSTAPEIGTVETAERFFHDLVYGRIANEEELAQRMRAAALDLDQAAYPCALVSLHIGNAAGTVDATTVQNRMLSSFSSGDSTIRVDMIDTSDNRSVFCAVSLQRETDSVFTKRLSTALDNRTESVRSAFKIDVDFNILGTVTDIAEFLPSRSGGKLIETVNHDSGVANLKDDPVLSRVEQYLFKHFASDISLSDVASRAFLSPVYFSKYFKDRTGHTFTDYLAGIRVEKAISLLRENRLKIHEIGSRVGYPNPRYFARVFKKRTGYSPREYCIRVLAMESES